MSLIQFALFIPLLFFVFLQSGELIKSGTCRSLALNKAVAKTLEGIVNEAKLSIPFKLDLRCGFYISETKGGNKAVFPLKGRELQVIWSLDTGMDFE